LKNNFKFFFLKFYSLELDDNGCIDFNGFLSLLDGRWDDSQFGKVLAQNLFKEFDKNKTGFLDMVEFKLLVAKLESITQREPSTRIELDAKFREVDKNGNGKLTMDGLYNINAFYILC